MLQLKIGPKHLWVELWSRFFSFRDWDFHFEHRTTLFDTRALWIGPFHILLCDTRHIRADQSLPAGVSGVAHNG